MSHIPENGHIWSITSFPPTFVTLTHGLKSTRLIKIYISTRKYSLSEGNFSPSWRNTIGHLLLDTMADSLVWLTIITDIISSNPIPHRMVPFFWFLYINKKNVKRGRGKGDRQQLRNFNHKGKNKIGFYPKSLLIFTAYKVQGWWTTIISPIKDQPDGINVREILLNISWNKHLKNISHKYLLKKSEGASRWILYSSLICLNNHPNIWW